LKESNWLVRELELLHAKVIITLITLEFLSTGISWNYFKCTFGFTSWTFTVYCFFGQWGVYWRSVLFRTILLECLSIRDLLGESPYDRHNFIEIQSRTYWFGLYYLGYGLTLLRLW